MSRLRVRFAALRQDVAALRHNVAAIRHGVTAMRHADDGMSTAEYAIGTLGAVAIATALVLVARSDAVSSALSALVQRALSVSL
jgi:hypothetical protein